VGVICKKYDCLETPHKGKMWYSYPVVTAFYLHGYENNKGWDFTGELLLTVTALKVKTL
jgi:hypothetical protein